MLDRQRKGRQAKGNQFPHAKLNPAAVVEIRESYCVGAVTQQNLADEFKVHVATINDVLKHRKWKHVESPQSANLNP